MNTRIILSVVVIALGAISAMFPSKVNNALVPTEEEIQWELRSGASFINADELAESLINKDPSYFLIDIRDVKAYEQSAIPNSINIPFDSLFSENWIGYLDQNANRNILISTEELRAREVFELARRKGFKNNYILAGGFKAWENTIINPPHPSVTAPETELILYQKRLASSQFFTGKTVNFSNSTTKKPVLPIKRKKKKAVQGGCS